MAATSDDVARAAGVSRATVSQILNGKGSRFAARTRDRVSRVAEELGYAPSIAGRTLANGSSDIVIALVPQARLLHDLHRLYELATHELAVRGLTLMLRVTSADPRELERVLDTVRPRAVVSFVALSAREHDQLAARGVLSLDPSTAGGWLEPDHELGRFQAETLADRGYRRLAYALLDDARQDVFGSARRRGLDDVAGARGLPRLETLRLGIDRGEASACLRSLPETHVGIACYDDEVATALLSAAADVGRRVPDDLGIIGMGDTPLGALTTPALSTVRVDVEMAAHLSVAHILRGLGLEDMDDPGALPRITLVDRGTLRPPR
jgi:DNA-binding LacI/PurR family transcriptional regulator